MGLRIRNQQDSYPGFKVEWRGPGLSIPIAMDERAFYTKILGIKLPWYVKQVKMDEAAQRIDIYVEREKDIRVRCHECGKFYGM